MKKRLLSPRGYLSHTQIDLWMRRPELYIERYVHGGAEQRSARMDFGSKAALALENGEETDDELLNMLVTVLPKYDLPEEEIRAILDTPAGSVELLGKPDTLRSTDWAFREYKTGVAKWTQGRADKHRQLDHYASILWLNHKKLPASIHLDWAETIDDDGRIALTGKVATFEVKKTVADVLKYLALAGKVAREIDEAYRKELQKLS